MSNCKCCSGYGCVDDDPEVRGAVVECPACDGTGDCDHDWYSPPDWQSGYCRKCGALSS